MMMNKKTVGLVVMAGLLFSGGIYAEEGYKHEHMSPAKTGAQTIQGEVLDMACFMGHEAKGPKHQACALKCIKDGAPMGLMSKDGKVYLLVENHDAPKAYQQTKDWAGTQVKIKGEVIGRGGLSALVVESSEKAN
jgi:hypothetical protein